MGWYRRGKLVLEGFHNLASRVSHQNSVSQPSFRILPSWYLNSGSKVASFNRFSSISKRFSTRGFGIYKNLMRFYSVDPKNVQHSCNCMPKKRWFQKPRRVFVVGSVVLGVSLVYFGNTETVPYTKRAHLILMPKAVERWLGEALLEKKKVKWKDNILPARHSESITVRMIGNNIIDAFKKKGGEGGLQHYSSHLDELNWEFLVVDNPDVNAFCYPGGKIIVYTGILEHLSSHAEIATILGHEVGHAVARHSAERMTRYLGDFILQFILYPFITPDLFKELWSLFFNLPFSRRNEMEADYIGLLLLASAGYDPRVAPTVYEKFDKLDSDSRNKDYLSTHPSGKKRAELLAQAKVMEEALTIYKNVRGDGQGFLHDCYNYFVKLYQNS